MRLIEAAFYILLMFLIGCQEHITIVDDNQYDPKSNNYVPTAPTSLQVKGIGETFVELSWVDESYGESGFIIEREDSLNSGFVPIDTVSSGITSYRDNFILKANHNYYYRLIAFKDLNRSIFIDTIEVNLEFLPPSNLTFQQIDKNTIKLTWQYNSNFEESFKVFYKSSIGEPEFTLFGEVHSDYNYVIGTDLDTSAFYEFKVQASTQYNQSNFSNTLKVIYSIMPKIQSIIDERYVYNLDFAFLNNSNLLLVPGDSHSGYRTLKIWNADNGTIGFSTDFYNEFAKFHPKEPYIGFPSENCVVIYNFIQGTVIDTISIKGNHIEFNQAGDKIVISGFNYGNESFLAIYDLVGKQILWEIKNVQIIHPRFTSDDNFVIGIDIKDSPNDKIVMFAVCHGRLINSIDPNGFNIYDYAISSDSRFVAFSASDNKGECTGSSLEVWDLESDQKIQEIKTDEGLYAFDFSPDSKILTFGTHIYRTSDYKLIGRIPNDFLYQWILASVFNYNGKLLSIAQEFTEVKVYYLDNQWDYYLD